MTLPKNSKDRKTYPLYAGLWQYFPAALSAVAHVSHVGNEQHNPGENCFDNREKSNDDYDCMLRHLAEADQLDDDGMLHAAKVAWRALRACQKILENRGADWAPAARFPTIDALDWEPETGRPIEAEPEWRCGDCGQTFEEGPCPGPKEEAEDSLVHDAIAEALENLGIPVKEEDEMYVHPSLERIPNMEHRDYYKFDPTEAICPCAHPHCVRTIKACDTPVLRYGQKFCSYVCATETT